jgi:hypothetical protein
MLRRQLTAMLQGGGQPPIACALPPGIFRTKGKGEPNRPPLEETNSSSRTVIGVPACTALWIQHLKVKFLLLPFVKNILAEGKESLLGAFQYA